MTMDWQAIQIPLANGVNQDPDPRALEPPALAVAKDVVFDNPGGIQTRPALVEIPAAIYLAGGVAGSLSNIRRIVANGTELLAFTKDKLYTWNPSLSGWTERATHLAIATEETPRFATTSDQTMCDRAECQNIIAYAWGGYGIDTSGGSPPSSGTGASRGLGAPGITIAVCDKETGAVIVSPTYYANYRRPRLVATDDWIGLFCYDSSFNSLYVTGIDATDPATGVASVPGYAVQSLGAGAASYCMYDVIRKPGTGNLVYYATTLLDTTTYAFGVVDVTNGSPINNASANTCDGPIAVATTQDGLTYYLNVLRATTNAGTHSIRSDLYNGGTFAGVHVNTAISNTTLTGTAATVSQITAAYRDARDSGVYRCYVFWSADEHDLPSFAGTTFGVAYNYVDTANAVGIANASITTAPFALDQSLGSRAFTYDGHVYVHTAFANESADATDGTPAQVQNTYFLFRDDKRLCGKMVALNAGGYVTDGTNYQSARGILPGVTLLNSTTHEYAWCAQHRRIVPTDSDLSKAYEARSPVDVSITFDDNRARRVARLGNTLYVTGAEVMAWDGENLVECGFHICPWDLFVSAFGAGNVEAGTHIFKATWRWDNGAGERDRSTSTGLFEFVDAGTTECLVGYPYLNITHKSDAQNPVVVEVWRTQTNESDPFYLATDRDPTETGGDLTKANRFIPNIPTSMGGEFLDNANDAALAVLEENDETEGVLEHLAPPAAQIIIANDTRLFLAGVAGDPHRVWYSRVRQDGEVASFHDALTVPIPTAGGDITALAILSETLVVFRERAVYVVPGEGFDNASGGQNFGPARVVSLDCGALSAESVGRTDLGIVFKSDHGWYLLTPGWQTQFIGAPVSSYDSEDMLAVCTLEDKFQVRAVSSFRTLVWNFLLNQWCEWTTGVMASAAMWDGTYLSAAEDAVYEQSTDYASDAVGYGLDIETPWIKINDLAGRGRVRWIVLTGEYRAAHRVRMRVAFDYSDDGSGNAVWVDDVNLTPATSTVGAVEQFRHGPSRQRCQALKIRITAINSVTSGVPNNEALRLTGLALEVGQKRGLVRDLSVSQKG